MKRILIAAISLAAVCSAAFAAPADMHLFKEFYLGQPASSIRGTQACPKALASKSNICLQKEATFAKKKWGVVLNRKPFGIAGVMLIKPEKTKEAAFASFQNAVAVLRKSGFVDILHQAGSENKFDFVKGYRTKNLRMYFDAWLDDAKAKPEGSYTILLAETDMQAVKKYRSYTEVLSGDDHEYRSALVAYLMDLNCVTVLFRRYGAEKKLVLHQNSVEAEKF